ncbi:MAG TPA: PQQ-binding-like beta-propeller repeat protein, partial [Acidobacteriota bacterium]|nr:PQQ-binding-like beta-propeller repeat protein [Acidobacteriota bacterium]
MSKVVCSRNANLVRIAFSLMLLTFFYLPQESLLGQPGTMKWRFQTGGAIQGSPAIGPEGVIYVASTDRNLYAINPDGTEKWKFTADGVFFKPPVIAEDGTIHAADRAGNLYALNPDGSLKWTFSEGKSVTPSEMAIADNGTVYYATNADYFAVNPDGSQFWTISRPSESLVTGITIGQDGVVLATTQGRLIALHPLTGAERWVLNTASGSSDIGPAMADDGTIYLGQRTTGENFFAVNPDGSLKWKATLDAAIDAGPSTAANGDLYVPINFKVQQGMNKGLLLALDSADGSEKWRYETDGGVGTVPAVGFDGTIYFATTANKLIALRPNGTELW